MKLIDLSTVFFSRQVTQPRDEKLYSSTTDTRMGRTCLWLSHSLQRGNI